MSDFRPLVALIFTVNYDVLLYTLPAAALVAGAALVIFYSKKTIPEMVAIFAGLFLILSTLSLGVLHFVFRVPVGRVEVVRYTGEGPPDGRYERRRTPTQSARPEPRAVLALRQYSFRTLPPR